MDVLTVEEESVLSSIRGFVACMRGRSVPAHVEYMEGAIVSAGGSVSSVAGASGLRIFCLCGARFSIRPAPDAVDKVEVSFIPGDR
jgi:hypothetical protein